MDEVRPAGPDPERDRRRDLYADRERRRAARALDRFLEAANEFDTVASTGARVAGERFVEQVGDYVLARLQRGADEPPWGESSHLAVRGCEIHGDACAGDPLQQKAHYGVADLGPSIKLHPCAEHGCPDPEAHAEGAHDV